MEQEVKHLILFDGVCNLCNSTVNFIIRNDKKNLFKFSSLQSEIGIPYLRNSNLESILYIRNHQVLNKSTAALYIAKDLGFPYAGLFIFYYLPTSWRDSIYNFIAKNRYRWFGKKDQCQIPTAETKKKFI